MLQSWGDRDAARVHSGGVNAAYMTPSGSRAVTVSGDHTARVWDVATAECRCVLTGTLLPNPSRPPLHDAVLMKSMMHLGLPLVVLTANQNLIL